MLIKKLFTPDTTKWILKCKSINNRNDWFDCIRCFVSQNKNAVYIERKKKMEPESKENMEQKMKQRIMIGVL